MEMPCCVSTKPGLMLRRCLSGLFTAFLFATPYLCHAAMVYGAVTGCTGSIEVWKGNTRFAVVPIRNNTFQVVLPTGSYRAICVDANSQHQELTIRSDPSPVRQNLGF